MEHFRRRIKPVKTCNMELFAKIVTDLKPLNISGKKSVVDV